MKRALLDALLAARADKVPAALVTRLADGEQALILPNNVQGNAELAAAAQEAAQSVLRHDRPSTIETAEGPVFVNAFNPALRLVLVGAVHISQALAPMASLAGYQVCVVDPRRAFTADHRFPGVEVATEWPDDALARLVPDHRTAVVTLTHDPKIDDPALHAALKSEAFYIGSLGSTRTHAARLKRLAQAGFSEAECARIHGPVGLSIGAKSPAEIAVAVLAQITQVLHDGAAA
ncbi:MAG: XdhC family protein [Alphaproteobacteria bacterium]|nr:XdhC family protein [Alphaproteobacteria bacterium]